MKKDHSIEITHNKESQRFHCFMEGGECYLKYRSLGPTMLEYYETFVPFSERKKGIATRLVEEALRFAQLNNYNIVPTCNFVAQYMDDHHQYAKMRTSVKGKRGGSEAFITS